MGTVLQALDVAFKTVQQSFHMQRQLLVLQTALHQRLLLPIVVQMLQTERKRQRCDQQQQTGQLVPAATLHACALRCRTASNKQTPVATETFKLLTLPNIGILT